jgi:hypothetical protein
MTQVIAAQNIKNELKPSIKNKKMEKLKSKPMHGQFYQELERPLADKEKSLESLCSSGLKYNSSSPRSSTQDVISSEEDHNATN